MSASLANLGRSATAARPAPLGARRTTVRVQAIAAPYKPASLASSTIVLPTKQQQQQRAPASSPIPEDIQEVLFTQAEVAQRVRELAR
jgi:hypothetical protein